MLHCERMHDVGHVVGLVLVSAGPGIGANVDGGALLIPLLFVYQIFAPTNLAGLAMSLDDCVDAVADDAARGDVHLMHDLVPPLALGMPVERRFG